MAAVQQYDLDALRESIFGLNALKVLHSKALKEAYGEMEDDAFSFDYETIDQEEAGLYLELLRLSEALFELVSLLPEIVTLVPQEVFRGMSNVKKQLSPWQKFLTKAANAEDFDREKEMMKIVSGHLNQEFLKRKLGS